MLIAEISAQMPRCPYEDRNALVKIKRIILRNSKDHGVKKDHGQTHANLAEAETKEFFKCGKVGHIARDCRANARFKCAECGGKHLTSMYDEAARFTGNRDGKDRKENANTKERIKTRSRSRRGLTRQVAVVRVVQMKMMSTLERYVGTVGTGTHLQGVMLVV